MVWTNWYFALQWRHNDHDVVSNQQPHGCLLNRLFRRRSKKTSKLRVTGLCVGNSPGPVNSPHKGPVTRKRFPFDDVIMACFRALADMRYWCRKEHTKFARSLQLLSGTLPWPLHKSMRYFTPVKRCMQFLLLIIIANILTKLYIPPLPTTDPNRHRKFVRLPLFAGAKPSPLVPHLLYNISQYSKKINWLHSQF